MPFERHDTGYRQPGQARAFGTAALAASGLLVTLLLGMRLFAPPSPPLDAHQAAVFVAESIPLDQPAPPRRDPSPPDAARLDPPLPAAAAALPSPSMEVTAPAIAAVPSVAMSAIDPLVRPASEPGLPSSVTVAKPVESPAAPAPAAPTTAAADWRARLLAHLKRYRRYPRQAEAARQQGVARVAITLHRSGDVVAVELVHGSGYPLLDMEARTTVRRASPLPAVDDAVPGDPVTVEVPIDFALRR